MRIAVFGMGRMGRAMAGRLLSQGHHVTIWNRTPGRAPELLDMGAREAPSVAEGGSSAEAVLISLADDHAVRAVVLGPSGLVATGTKAVIVNASTVSPASTQELQAHIPERLVVSPVLGAPRAVASGSALWLLSGARDTVEYLEPMWAALSERRLYCGPDPATASTLKLIANYLLMTGVASLAEAVALGQTAGVQAGLLREFLSTIPTVAPGLHNRLDDVLTGDHQGWFTTRLGAKDVRLFEEVATAAGLRVPIAALVRSRYEEASDAGWDAADLGAVVELLRARRP
jgi:3-hydroxyisobutyrate dehydrogenase-like beta-hydroxyacid dehydrogenase